ncbi:hypothetical protein [Streptomyces sp. PH10-H1]|uniref:hypothetical protein n=1 Tax=Streptomyces sp. PH10-H1 TaxID=3046212 RepID=UPI0024B9776B|nr:hypothetical protein [Streptomyces sp. PH10-H1]
MQATGAVWLVFNVLHLLHHLQHLGMYEPVGQVLNAVLLSALVLVSVLLLVPSHSAQRDGKQ